MQRTMEIFNFDPQERNVKLAKEYITKHNNEFHSIGYEDSDSFVEDSCHNKIYSKKLPTSKDNVIEYSHVIKEKFELLASIVEENAELFAELEYMIRNIPKNEIMDCDLKLITNNFKNLCHNDISVFDSNSKSIYMTGDVELAHIGIAAQIILTTDNYCDIYADANCFVVCHLFAKLCHEVGLISVRVSLLEDFVADVHDRCPNAICNAVISQKSDIASSVDLLKNTSHRGCWRLTRVFVQESAYRLFKDNLNSAYKLHEKSLDNNTKIVQIKEKCLMAYEFSDKLFLLNFTGNTKEINDLNKSVILIEAYRTNKELISILNENKPFFLSIWCQDIMEANEIAFGVQTNVVWLNDIFTFNGPLQESQAYYNTSFVSPNVNNMNNNKKNELGKLFRLWQKKSLNERRDAVINVVSEIEKKCPLLKREINDLIRKIKTGPDTFAYVCDNSMCLGLDKSYDEIIYVNIQSESSLGMLALLRCVADGNAVVYRTRNHTEEYVRKAILENGLPLFNYRNYCDEDDKINWSHSVYRTRIVHSHFGTIFAN